jgi:hypothetical protein
MDEPEPLSTPPATGQPDAQPLGVGVQPTGHLAVDAQLARLADADSLPVSAHVEVYEDAHRALRDTLTALDQHPGPALRTTPRS